MNAQTARIIAATTSICITFVLMVAGTISHNTFIIDWGVWTVAPAAVLMVDLFLRRERLRVEQIIYLCERRRDAEMPVNDVSRIR